MVYRSLEDQEGLEGACLVPGTASDGETLSHLEGCFRRVKYRSTFWPAVEGANCSVCHLESTRPKYVLAGNNVQLYTDVTLDCVASRAG